MKPTVLELIKGNLKDPTLFTIIEKTMVQQARKTAIILGSFLIVALVAVVYAFVQLTIAKQAMRNAEVFKSESEKQMGLSREAMMIAEEANREVMDQLLKCQQQNKK